MHSLRLLWSFRHFIWASIQGELKRRFVRSKFGAFWFVLHPAAQTAIFALVLSDVLSARIAGKADKAAYAVYLMAGMAAWGLFSEIITRCTTIFIEYGVVMKKIAFPRLCLPIIVGGSALLNHTLLLAAIAAVFVFFGHFPGAAWIVLPIGMVMIAMFAFGLGVLLGVINVFVRDVGQVLGVAIQIWFWLTPIVYTLDVLPERIRPLSGLNPFVPLADLYQQALLYDRFPAWQTLVYPASVSACLLFFAFVVFRRASAEIVDAL